MQNAYLVQCVQIGIAIVHIICIGWIENIGPLLRCWHVFCWAPFWFAFIIHQIQPNHLKNISTKEGNYIQILKWVPSKMGGNHPFGG